MSKSNCQDHLIVREQVSRFDKAIKALYEIFPQLDKFYMPSTHSRNGSYGIWENGSCIDHRPGIWCVLSGSWKTVEEQCPVTVDGVTFSFHSFTPEELGDDRIYEAHVNIIYKLDKTWY